MNDNNPFEDPAAHGRRRARIALVFATPLLLASTFMLDTCSVTHEAPWIRDIMPNPAASLDVVKAALKLLIVVALFLNIFVIVFMLFMILREKMGSLKIGTGIALASVIGIVGTVESLPGKPAPQPGQYPHCITVPIGGGFHGYSAPAAAPSAAPAPAPAAPAPTGGGAGA